MYLAHEKLDFYRLALEVARWAAAVAIQAHRKHLRDQLARGADSIVLNIAEGAGLMAGDAQRHHYRIALGSTSEVGAILDLLAPPNHAELRDRIVRVAAMLSQLARR